MIMVLFLMLILVSDCLTSTTSAAFYSSLLTCRRLSSKPSSSWISGGDVGDWKTRMQHKIFHQLDTTKLRAARYDDFYDDYLLHILQQNGWDSRIVTLSDADLPLTAEVQQQGTTRVGMLQEILWEGEDGKAPKCRVQIDEQDLTIDLGQLTTVWVDEDDTPKEASPNMNDPLSMTLVEKTLDQLYDDSMMGPTSRKKGLTKKEVNRLVQDAPGDCHTTVDTVLRQLIKTGSSYSRLMDSQLFLQAVRGRMKKSSNKIHRLQASQALNEFGGGRFKRMPCIWLDSNSHQHQQNFMTFINGGWIFLDAASRAASEARQLAERGTSITEADDRIVRRLEYLAMDRNKNHRGDYENDAALEVDVREFLKARQLPVNSDGAKQALVDMGIWSSSAGTEGGTPYDSNRPQPWSPDILEAAKWYRDVAQRQCVGASINHIVDLTKLPCLCIDAARTTFRDDAVGVRSRASTGRKVSPNAKWELLLHIADVSDIYVDDPMALTSNDKSSTSHLENLRKAAASRGISRYDLPSGPMHLLPPIALDALALDTINPDLTSKKDEPLEEDGTETFCNRCVTVWVYIDEKTGKLLDAGVERTHISRPLALSFQTATELLEGTVSKNDDVAFEKARLMLAVVERNLQLWNDYRRERDASARAREDRLAAREKVGQQLHGDYKSSNIRDDGRQGFQRSRGHRIVDSCLDVYGFILAGLLKRSKTSIPRVAGTERDGRIGTAPLRRYVDGVIQKQALAVFCDYGGAPLSKSECVEIGKHATETINKISNIKSSKNSSNKAVPIEQQKAVRALQFQINKNTRQRQDTIVVPAMSTGKQSEVVILGVGALASCRGIKGTLKPGERVMVKIRNIDEANGKISVILANDIA